MSVTLTFTGVMGLVGPRLNASVEPAGTNGRQKRMENRPYSGLRETGGGGGGGG